MRQGLVAWMIGRREPGKMPPILIAEVAVTMTLTDALCSRNADIVNGDDCCRPASNKVKIESYDTHWLANTYEAHPAASEKNEKYVPAHRCNSKQIVEPPRNFGNVGFEDD